jgi:hypothetical protein
VNITGIKNLNCKKRWTVKVNPLSVVLVFVCEWVNAAPAGPEVEMKYSEHDGSPFISAPDAESELGIAIKTLPSLNKGFFVKFSG